MNSSTDTAIPFALIIDDDPFMRLLARESLEQIGIRVAEAGDGSSGLAAVEELWPDIILLDVVMPDMDGFAVCRHLRGLTGGRHLPILMLTGLHDIDSIEHAYDAGATDFITKPIVGPILGHRVRYMLNASRAMRDLAKSEAKLANAQHIAVLGSWEWDTVEDRTSWSEELYRICGMEPSASEGTYEGFLHLVHPDDRKLVEAAVKEALTQATPYSLDHRIVRPDGTERVVHGQAKVVTNQAGTPLLMHGTMQDITERKQTEEHIRATESQLANILDSIDNAVWSISAATYEVLYLNPAAERIFGRSTTEFQIRKELWLEMIHPEDQDHLRGIYATLSEENILALEYRIIRPDGNVRWLESRAKITHDGDGAPLHIDGIATDITERKKQEARINHLANYDSLTGLPNRNLLNDRLGQAIFRAYRTGERLAMLCLDLDGFKFINDSFGHPVGDALLKMVANRLRASVRKCDTVARLGGDEFIIVLQGLSIDEVVDTIVQNVLGTFTQPFVVGCHELHVTASIGISKFPDDGDTSDVLLKNADVAMYGAKGKGRNCYHFYMHNMSILAERRVELESALRLAIERQEFEVYYQPKVNLRNGRICGAEALVRWNRPGFGLVPPDCFISLAEETGLIMPIGEWVLRNACIQAKRWHDMGYSNLTMAVNLSARQVWHQAIPELVGKILADTGLAARCLELELTESALINDSDFMLEVMHQLKTIGVLLTLDDFGTGYSSLSYLKRFPFDVLKIDRSFIQDVTSDENDTTLTKTIILMAHSLKMKTVAEGVETEGQLAFLNVNKCDEIQGYYFSRPVSSAGFTQILEQGKCFPTSYGSEKRRDILLILDDEPNVVSALCRQLSQDDYHILRAQTPAEAFELLALHSVQVIVSDQRMSIMTSTEFLGKVKEMYPDTIRIILTGYAELTSVVEAINCGAVYRFITKPWDDRELRNIIKEAFHQHWLNHDAKSNESSRNAML